MVCGLKSLFEKLNISPGKSFLKYCLYSDYKHISEMGVKTSEKVIKQCKQIRASKKKYGDKVLEKEGETCVAGGF